MASPHRCAPATSARAELRRRASLLVLAAAALLVADAAGAAESATGPTAEAELDGTVRAGAARVPGDAPAAVPAPAPGGASAGPASACHRIDASRVACYETPRFYSFVANAPLDVGRWLKRSFRRENAAAIGGVAVATAGLLLFDQDLVHGAKDLGRATNVSATGKQKDIIPGIPIQYPTDVGSTLYYLGDGMVPVGITAGLLGYGLFVSDSRALQTTSQLVGSLLSVGLVVQTIKRTTGRQTPNRATEDGGDWDALPSPSRYQKNVPNFDAFPSGHMATAMATVTVLAENYPEYRLIRPVGYGLMALLGFQMMNNGVHWASDYPVAIAIGYGIGKTAATHGRSVVEVDEAAPGEVKRRAPSPGVTMVPMPLPGGAGLSLAGVF
jgi:membrane-associated phospholipid phosphatase